MNARTAAQFVGIVATLVAGVAMAQQTSPAGTAPMAQRTVKVLCTQALRTSLQELAPRFERTSGHKVELVIAPSGRLTARVRDGEQADLVIANAPNIDSLI